jgi:hypothetical protein
MWGRQIAEEMLRAAGFSSVSVHDAAGDPIHAIYVCRARPPSPEVQPTV